MVDIISLKIDNKINYTWEIIISGTLLGRHFISQLTKCNIIVKKNNNKIENLDFLGNRWNAIPNNTILWSFFTDK